ncbi:hypothetical protein EMVG_00025 [Emiliania huxleyi virus PS401]|nr:hypothetical protein EMVG_00025 [Emiliania huxleyi virus PS401]
MDWLWDVLNWLAAAVVLVAAWAGGEAGRAYVAGASGGLFRWLTSPPPRTLPDAAGALFGGALAAAFLTPLVVAILRLVGLDLGESAAAAGTYHFLTGVFGMSLTKIAVGLVEAELALRTRRANRSERDDDQPR